MEQNWLSMDEAVRHCTRGIGVWEWARTSSSATANSIAGPDHWLMSVPYPALVPARDT